jgi:hypothetical protein
MTHTIKPLKSHSLARTGLAFAVALLAGPATSPLIAQTDNFNDGDDSGWTHYSITGFYVPAFPDPHYCPYGATAYTFPADDSGGKAYHVEAAPTTWSVTGTDAYGVKNARGGSYRASPTYTNRFRVGSDLLAWSTTGRPTVGFLWYTHDIYLGSTKGYAGTFSPNAANVYLSSLYNEGQAYYFASLTDGDITLKSTDRIRMEVSSHDGQTFAMTVYNQLEPNTPWASAIGSDSSYFGVGGICGYLIFNEDYPANYGVGATFDNYSASEPAAGAMPAMVTDVFPPPAGKAKAFYPTLSVAVMNRDTAVTYDPSAIAVCLDGIWLPADSLTIDWSGVHKANRSYPGDFPGVTITYPITNLYTWGTKHTNIFAFKDDANTWRTNTWTWTTAYPMLFASNSLPLGSLTVRGFDVRMAQTTNGGVKLENSLERARQQLAGTIPVDQRATSIVQVLNWNKNSAYPDNVPGLCPGSDAAPINIAVETCAYLHLTPGVHRLHIETDDRAGVYSGLNLADNNALWEASGSTANTTFEFYAEAEGLYPFRCLWEETGGSAKLILKSVDVNDLTEVLINDGTDPAGVVKAWYPIVCKSATNVTGPYSLSTTAVNRLDQVDSIGTGCQGAVVGQKVTGGTLTIPATATARYYLLDSPRTTRITGITRRASEVEITYQLQ